MLVLDPLLMQNTVANNTKETMNNSPYTTVTPKETSNSLLNRRAMVHVQQQSEAGTGKQQQTTLPVSGRGYLNKLICENDFNKFLWKVILQTFGPSKIWYHMVRNHQLAHALLVCAFAGQRRRGEGTING